LFKNFNKKKQEWQLAKASVTGKKILASSITAPAKVEAAQPEKPSKQPQKASCAVDTNIQTDILRISDMVSEQPVRSEIARGIEPHVEKAWAHFAWAHFATAAVNAASEVRISEIIQLHQARHQRLLQQHSTAMRRFHSDSQISSDRTLVSFARAGAELAECQIKNFSLQQEVTQLQQENSELHTQVARCIHIISQQRAKLTANLCSTANSSDISPAMRCAEDRGNRPPYNELDTTTPQLLEQIDMEEDKMTAAVSAESFSEANSCHTAKVNEHGDGDKANLPHATRSCLPLRL